LLLNKKNTIKQEIQHKETAEEVKYKKLQFIFSLRIPQTNAVAAVVAVAAAVAIAITISSIQTKAICSLDRSRIWFFF
jgi:uncharacterized UPF0146 family protein